MDSAALLLALPPEVFALIAHHLCDVTSLCSLAGSCKAARSHLEDANRLLRGLVPIPILHTDGSGVAIKGRGAWAAWASGSDKLLETGRTVWRVRPSGCNMLIGVCDSDDGWAWGLEPASGRLFRERPASESIGDPPTHYPDGDGTQVLPLGTMFPSDGTVVLEVLFDADLGELSFRVVELEIGRRVVSNSESSLTNRSYFALGGFPRSLRLRTWARLFSRDTLTTVGGWHGDAGVASQQHGENSAGRSQWVTVAGSIGNVKR